MSEQLLQQIYTDILRTHFPGKKYPIQVVFYNTKSLRHTIELKSSSIFIRIADQFISAPERILYVLGIILLTKLFRYKLSADWRREYNQYVDEFILPKHPFRTRKPSSKYTSSGRYFDLDSIFDQMNKEYFENALEKPVLGWSLNRSYTRLGFFSNEKNLLVISRIFDSKKVPEPVVEFLMYHEMLHIHIPAKTKNGRRSIHSKEFKIKERIFPEFEKIQRWIKKNRHRL